MLLCKVTWDDHVEKRIYRLPLYIQSKLRAWARAVEEDGIYKTRKLPGFHDEPLKGQRLGQRSVRLNRSYRIIYVHGKQGHIEIIRVIEVNKHEY